jgi:hypothetical protein
MHTEREIFCLKRPSWLPVSSVIGDDASDLWSDDVREEELGDAVHDFVE